MQRPDRYDLYCSINGCYSQVARDDIENPLPSLAGGLVLYPDPRVPMLIRDAVCGPSGCGPLLPTFPSRALFQVPPKLQWSPLEDAPCDVDSS